MQARSTTSTVTFAHQFRLPGRSDALPAGAYDVLAEEELLQGLTFSVYRRTATYLKVVGAGGKAGRTEYLPVEEADLASALLKDRAMARDTPAGPA